MPYLGMLLGGLAFVFLLLNALGGWGPKQMALHAVIALVTVGGMWSLFTFGLHVLLPPGEILGRF
jgi:putative tricarboxylic transport membrane protein